jgi:RimJ/RimL family protein N-acetyltransferase
MKVNISRATDDDAESISLIWEVICAERIYTAINRPFTPTQQRKYIENLSNREGIFVARINKQIVGFQSLDLFTKYTDSFDHVGVIGTFILPEWRRKGVAHLLAMHVIDFARNNHYEKFIIYVRAGNKNAQAFYKSLGYIQKGVLTKQVIIDDQYEDEIFLELFLKK